MRQSGQSRLPARDVATIPFTLDLNLPTLSDLMPEIMDKYWVNVRTEGVYKVKLGPSSINLRRTVEDELDINDQFQDFTSSQLENAIMFERVRLGGVGMSQTNIDLDIKINNPFSVPIQLNATDIDLFFDPNGQAFGRWEYDQTTEIGANSIIRLDAEVDLNNKNTILEAAKNLFGDRRVYARGTANIEFGGYPFDIKITQDVALSKAFGF